MSLWAAWLLVLPWVLLAVVRTFGLEGGRPFLEILALTPYLTAAVIIPMVTAIALRVWPAAAATVVAAVALLVAVVPRGFGGETAPAGEPGPTLRVLAANIEFGEGPADPLVALVEELDVDVLSVEELTPAFAERLERAGLPELLPRRVLDPEPGSGGGGFYTRLPVGDGRVEDLPGGFPLISVPVEPPGAPEVEISSVHTNPPTAPHWEEDLAALPAAEAIPLRILIGDFNATLDHAAFRDLLDRGYEDAAATLGEGFTVTWPVGRKLLPALFAIDHVLVDPRVGISAFSAHDLPPSDHRAVFAQLVLPAG